MEYPRAMTRPLKDWAGTEQSDAVKVNENDRDASGNFATGDPYAMGNPNAMGPRMRPLYDATAAAASGLADEHDQMPLKVRVQRGVVAAGGGPGARGAKDGADGAW